MGLTRGGQTHPRKLPTTERTPGKARDSSHPCLGTSSAVSPALIPYSKSSEAVLVGLRACVGGCGEVGPRMYVPLVPGMISTLVTVRQTLGRPPCLPHRMTKTAEYLANPVTSHVSAPLNATHYIYIHSLQTSILFLRTASPYLPGPHPPQHTEVCVGF